MWREEGWVCVEGGGRHRPSYEVAMDMHNASRSQLLSFIYHLSAWIQS